MDTIVNTVLNALKQGNKCKQLLGNSPRYRLEHVKLTNDNDCRGNAWFH